MMTTKRQFEINWLLEDLQWAICISTMNITHCQFTGFWFVFSFLVKITNVEFQLKVRTYSLKTFRAEYCDFTKKFGSKYALLKMANRNTAEMTEKESERKSWKLTVCIMHIWARLKLKKHKTLWIKTIYLQHHFFLFINQN